MDFSMQQTPYMVKALNLAHQAMDAGEVPVGAVVVDGHGNIIGEGINFVERHQNPFAHAEMIAMEQARLKIQGKWLQSCTLYVTLEPCTMCAAALSLARIKRVVFGAFDEKGGGIEQGARFYNQKTCHHRPEVIAGISEGESASLLRQFFKSKRDL